MTPDGKGGATPGPWEAVLPGDPRGQPVPYYRGLICLIQTEPEGTIAVVAECGFSDPSEWQANAQLIAQAPALRDALERLLQMLNLRRAVLCDMTADHIKISVADQKLEQAEEDARAALAATQSEGGK